MYIFDCSLGIYHADNQEILKKIVAEARTHLVDVSYAIIKGRVTLYPSARYLHKCLLFTPHHDTYVNVYTPLVYTDAVKTYYNSRRLKESGKYKDKVTKQRKKNR